MRIIDKDALEDAVQGAINVMESHGISMIAASVPLAIIKGAPTVDAIPIDWLREKMRGYASELKSTEMDAVVRVLKMWEQDQRKEKSE